MRYFNYGNYLEDNEKFNEQIARIYELESELVEKNPEPQSDLFIKSSIATILMEGMKLDKERAFQIGNPDFDLDENYSSMTRPEKEFLGYLDVLKTIEESYEYIGIRPNIILQLHRDMYQFINAELGGNYRNACIYVNEVKEDGSFVPYFEPLEAHETMNNLQVLCEHYDTLEFDRDHALIAAIMFLLDFYLIHPFNFGNGEALRFMTRLMFLKNGLHVFSKISLEEMMLEDDKAFLEAVRDSAIGHVEGDNDYTAFVAYMLDLIEEAYKRALN